jgi:hypothetical protein
MSGHLAPTPYASSLGARGAPAGAKNSGDTILIPVAVPPVSSLGDVSQNAGSNARYDFSSPPVCSANQYRVLGRLNELGSIAHRYATVSGRFRMESDAKRACYLENGGEARIAVLAESLVETLATQTGVARNL